MCIVGLRSKFINSKHGPRVGNDKANLWRAIGRHSWTYQKGFMHVIDHLSVSHYRLNHVGIEYQPYVPVGHYSTKEEMILKTRRHVN